MGTGRLRLPRQSGERGCFTADHGPCEVESFAAEQRQKHAVVRPGVAGQLDEICVVAVGGRGWNVERCGPAIDAHLEPSLFEITRDQDDRIPIGSQRWEAPREHPESGVSSIGSQ